MWHIGKLKLNSRLILAPLAGITDLPFRMLNRRFGCELAFVEMINCRSISYKSKRTKAMLASVKTDKPLGLQLLGCEAKFIARAHDILKDYKFDLLDFNAACPARKVVRRGEGAGLLREPKKLGELLSLLVKNSPVPVTVKIRIGWDSESINARDVAVMAEDSGVSAIFVHGRTRLQEYHGEVEYKVIRQVKEVVKIPVIASGNIFSGILAKKMIDETGCDGLAVARGSLGNPWIFKEIEHYLSSGKILERPRPEEIASVMMDHLEENAKLFGDRIGVMKFRKFFAYYTKGFRKIRPLREESSRAKTKAQMLAIIERSIEAS